MDGGSSSLEVVLEGLKADAQDLAAVAMDPDVAMPEGEPEAVGVGLRTAKRDWAKARSWLYAELYAEPEA